VAHEVINVGRDHAGLSSMVKKSQEALGRMGIGLIADRGYYKGAEIPDSECAGIPTLCPSP
jgi:hypothetical protein